MGILDDAIRQHLELKRRQGAADDELARLEDEAFGPPTRPGEPDFPSAEASADALAPADPQALAGAEHSEAAVGTGGDHAPETTLGEAAGPAAVALEAPDDAGSAESAEPTAGEPQPEQAGLADRADSGEIELDELDLELDDEFSELGEIEADGPPIPSLDTVEHPPPVESLDTVEHPVEERSLEEDDAGQGGAPMGGEEEVLEGEDVLEETPEFLRDQPEDDELWFEQGEPKDFDF